MGKKTADRYIDNHCATVMKIQILAIQSVQYKRGRKDNTLCALS